MADLKVAQTILEQLGGARFIAMTGASLLVGGPDRLAFSLPGGTTKNKANKVQIILTSADLYTIEFFRIRRADVTVLGFVQGVYADQLAELFEAETGLRVSL